jgi:hypothetical protein
MSSRTLGLDLALQGLAVLVIVSLPHGTANMS